jgi:hypothetical protein
MFPSHTAAGKPLNRPIVKACMAETDMPSRLRPASWAADVHVSRNQETDRARSGLACSIGLAGPMS